MHESLHPFDKHTVSYNGGACVAFDLQCILTDGGAAAAELLKLINCNSMCCMFATFTLIFWLKPCKMTQRNKNFDANNDCVCTDFSILVMILIAAVVTFRVTRRNLNILIPAYVTNIKCPDFWLRRLLWNKGLSRLLKSGFDAEMHKQ